MDINAWRASELHWNRTHQPEYLKSSFDVNLAKRYWLVKEHINPPLKNKVEAYIDTHEHLLHTFATQKIDLHDVLQVVTFYLLNKNGRDNEADAQSLRYSEWKKMI